MEAENEGWDPVKLINEGIKLIYLSLMTDTQFQRSLTDACDSSVTTGL